MKFSHRVTASSFAVLVVAFAAHLQAVVTNVAWYRLGENDPGATSSGAVTNTVDLIDLKNLKPYNGPLYASAVSASAMNRVGSSFAVNFNGTSQYLSNAVVSIAVNNFGMEAWVRPNATALGNRAIVCNGSPTASGWTLFQRAGTEFSANLGGVTSFGS